MRIEIILGIVIGILALYLLTRKISKNNRRESYRHEPLPFALQMNYIEPTLIPYVAGTEGPLRFYGGRTLPPSLKWQRVGNVYSESKTDDTVYELEQRMIPPFNDDSYEYQVHDTFKGTYIQLSEHHELKNGVSVNVPGKDSINPFVVTRDKDYVMVRM